jgi:hypothetical protein
VAYNAGREAPYAERLLFEVPEAGTEDLDESHLSGSLLQQAVGKLKDAVTPGGGEEVTDRRTPADRGDAAFESLDGRGMHGRAR